MFCASQTNAGLTETRNGLSKTQSGIDGFVAGSHQAGLEGIATGMGMMDHGMTSVRQGMGMMSGNMTASCADGGSDAIVQPMLQARDEMHRGQGMLADDAGANDDDAISRIQNGMARMKTALDQAQTCMACMNHGDMSAGGMM